MHYKENFRDWAEGIISETILFSPSPLRFYQMGFLMGTAFGLKQEQASLKLLESFGLDPNDQAHSTGIQDLLDVLERNEVERK